MCGVGVLQSWHDASMQLTATAGANVAQHAARAIPQGQQQALPYLKPHSVALHVTGLAPLPFRAKLTLQYCSAAGKQEEREGKEGRRAWLSELADQHQRTCQPRPAGPGQARPARNSINQTGRQLSSTRQCLTLPHAPEDASDCSPAAALVLQTM